MIFEVNHEINGYIYACGYFLDTMVFFSSPLEMEFAGRFLNGAPEVKTAVPWNLGDPSLVAIYSTTFVEVAWQTLLTETPLIIRHK